MVLHHRDAMAWDADQGKWVNASSTIGSGTPIGLGVTDVSGAANQLRLFPGATVHDNVLGRIGTVISASLMPTGAPGGEAVPATIASVIFNSGQAAEQTALLITTARYNGRSAAAFLIFSDSADGVTRAATHYGALTDGTAYGATHAFDTGIGTIVTGIVDGTVISGAQIIGSQIIADGSSGEFLVYSGPPASGNLIASVSGASGTDSFGNAYLAGITSYINTSPVQRLEIFNGQIQWSQSSSSAAIGPTISAGASSANSTLALSSGQTTLSASQADMLLNDSATSGTGRPQALLNQTDLSVTDNAPAGNVLSVANTHSNPSAATVQLTAAAAADRVLGIEVAGDAKERLQVNSNGQLGWGSGAANVDVNLSRVSAGRLEIDGDLNVIDSATSGALIQVENGSSPSTNQGNIVAYANAATDGGLSIRVTGDTSDRLQLRSDGLLGWSAGSGGAADTNLYRASANNLQTDDALTVGGLLTLEGGSNTAPSVPVRTPSFANGVAAQLGDLTRDYVLYIQIGTAGTGFSFNIGPTSTPANVIYASATPPAGLLLTVRLPAGWWVQWSGTGTTLAHQRAVGC